MKKSVTLGSGPKDQDLIRQIERYQKKENINFTEAIRRLCDAALQLKRIAK